MQAERARTAMAAWELVDWRSALDSESWRLTGGKTLAHASLSPLPAADATALLPLVQGIAAPRLVIANGAWLAELSDLRDLPAGVTVEWRKRSNTDTRPLAELSHGLGNDAVLVEVADGVRPERVFNVVHLLSGTPASDPANPALGLAGSALHVRLGKGGRLVMMEHYMGAPGASAGWLCDSLRVDAAEESELRHGLSQRLPHGAVLTKMMTMNVADSADCRSDVLQLGATLSRVEPVLNTGWATFCRINTLNLCAAEQTQDLTAVICHAKEATRSEVKQRNVVDEGGHAVFQGKFYVAQEAQKTDAYMRCENLLLHDKAKVSQKPELEIYADDVKCSHGASTGGLSDDQLFYLMARGLPETAAKRLLIEGFCQAFAEEADPAFKDIFAARVAAWLETH